MHVTDEQRARWAATLNPGQRGMFGPDGTYIITAPPLTVDNPDGLPYDLDLYLWTPTGNARQVLSTAQGTFRTDKGHQVLTMRLTARAPMRVDRGGGWPPVDLEPGSFYWCRDVPHAVRLLDPSPDSRWTDWFEDDDFHALALALHARGCRDMLAYALLRVAMEEFNK